MGTRSDLRKRTRELYPGLDIIDQDLVLTTDSTDLRIGRNEVFTGDKDANGDLITDYASSIQNTAVTDAITFQRSSDASTWGTTVSSSYEYNAVITTQVKDQYSGAHQGSAINLRNYTTNKGANFNFYTYGPAGSVEFYFRRPGQVGGGGNTPVAGQSKFLPTGSYTTENNRTTAGAWGPHYPQLGMVLDSDGTVGINTSDPNAQLEVIGDISQSYTSTGSFGSLEVGNLPGVDPLTTGSLWISGSFTNNEGKTSGYVMISGIWNGG